MKAIVALLVVAVIALAWEARSQKASSEEKDQRLTALNSQLDAKPKTANIDLQEKCTKQAREQFRQDGWEKESSAVFQNHYSEKLGKCFMLVESHGHENRSRVDERG